MRKIGNILCVFSLVISGMTSLSIFSACTSTKNYSGPALPADQVSSISFFSNRPLEMSDLAIDSMEKGLFDSSVEVLPGEHQAFGRFKISAVECTGKTCLKTVYSGTCNASLRTAAGHAYAIRVYAVHDEAFVSVKESASDEIAGSGDCKTVDRASTYERR